MRMSNKKINNAIEKLMIRKLVVIVNAELKLSINNPIHEVSGPGITGKKLPAIPSKIKKAAAQIIKRFMSTSLDLNGEHY
jgi:hypothetical protein